MPLKIAAANWKMNLTQTEVLTLTDTILQEWSPKEDRCRIILSPSYPFLSLVSERIKGWANVGLAAQDCSAYEQGAYTGEVSARQIRSCGAEYVIIGHSERRIYHGEDHALLSKKIKQALACGLKVIFCCGETLPQRHAGNHLDVVRQQLNETLFLIPASAGPHLVVAYEPVWAIGTGVNATADQAQQMHRYIRQLIAHTWSEHVASSIPLLYGGSCNEKVAGELFQQPDIDGGLIGGASLKAESFVAIARLLTESSG